MIIERTWVHFTKCDHYSELSNKDLQAEPYINTDATATSGGISLPYWCQVCIGDYLVTPDFATPGPSGYSRTFKGQKPEKHLNLHCWKGPPLDFSHLKLDQNQARRIEEIINEDISMRGRTADNVEIVQYGAYFVTVTLQDSSEKIELTI